MLEEETACSIKSANDVMMRSDNLTTMTLAVDFYRSTCISSLFQNFLRPLIAEIIGAKYVHLSIDPVSIYKTWIRDMEAESGNAMTKYPYSVTVEQALSYPQECGLTLWTDVNGSTDVRQVHRQLHHLSRSVWSHKDEGRREDYTGSEK